MEVFSRHWKTDPSVTECEPGARARAVDKVLEHYTKIRGRNNIYVFNFYALELFNLLNAVTQMWFMDMFMGGKFFDYGVRLWNHREDGGINQVS